MLRTGNQVVILFKPESHDAKVKVVETKANAALLEKRCDELKNSLNIRDRRVVAEARRENALKAELVSLERKLWKARVECLSMRACNDRLTLSLLRSVKWKRTSEGSFTRS